MEKTYETLELLMNGYGKIFNKSEISASDEEIISIESSKSLVRGVK